jgi:hypothetical protein
MSTIMKKRPVNIFKIPWYFIAFSSYPVLALLSYNISEVRFTSGIRSLVLSVAGATVLFLLFRLIYRSWHRAAFATTALTILFFSYGHIYDLLSQKFKFPYFTLCLLGVWLVIAILALVWAGWHKTKFNKATLGLNIVSLGLVLVVLVQVIWWSLPLRRGEIADDHAPLQASYIPSGEALPDIYYIIPDSYGRSDLLLQSFQIDNTAFIQHLQEMGFYVAGCSQSNYNRTDISLGSSLNMDYLQNLDDSYKPENQNGKTLLASINQSAVRYELERAGYKTVAFATGFAWSEITNANVYLAPSPDWFELNSFETLLIRTTMSRHFEALGGIHLDQIDGQRYRERTQFILSSMHELAHLPGPKFVFIHIISPHPPFVYGSDGTPTDPAAFLDQNSLYEADAYARGYTNQVEYISGQLVTALSTLLRESSIPPVIILQGDHGPWMQTGSNMFEILNAYYLPGHNDLLYPAISPVNTFRLVLDTYLGADYPLLDDTSYFSPIPNIYAFIKTANPCLNHKG